MAEAFWITCFRLGLTIVVWGLIEFLDSLFKFGLPGLLSLIIAAVLVFGGWFIIIDSDLDLFD